MTTSTAMAVADLINTEGVWTVFIGSEPAEPANTITIYDQEGELLQSHNRTLWETPRVQIRIRGLHYETTYAKMIAVQKDLILHEPFTDGVYRYEGFVMFGTPYNLGQDEQRRFVWSLNFRAHRKEIGT